MLKNPTPRQISIISASFIALASAALFALFLAITPDSFNAFLTVLCVFIIVLSVGYCIIIFYLKKYIYRKIKVIYKTIHKHKLTPDDKHQQIDVDVDIIQEVEREVAQWAVNQKKQIEKQKSWSDYRRKFVGDISHELKTPIFNIQGYLHTLLEGGLQDEQVNISFLEKAAKNVDRLYTIVEDLGAISRLESGELILDMQTFDIKALALEVFEDLEIKAKEKNITLGFKEGAGMSYKVIADRENIRQVFTNLVHNSIKYGRENGQTKVGFYDMDKNILVEVADNGLGIPKKHLNHVFDRFYRVDKSRSRAQGGSGLGLAIVKHIVEAHKQAINVRSTPDIGSTFGFTVEKA